MTTLKIFFEDAHIIVVEKPVGVLSQKDESGNENMCSLLEEHLFQNGETPYIAPIHRLDRGVGGIMVYAKSKKAAGVLSSQVADKEKFKKSYLAVINGVPAEKNAVLCDLLFKDTHLGKSFVVDRMRKGVKQASLEYELLSENSNFSLVRVTLHTGRTHQIRVQFSSRGHSLCGDKKYGARDGAKNIGLFACSLGFVHPETKKYMEFSSLPDYSVSPWDMFKSFFILPNQL